MDKEDVGVIIICIVFCVLIIIGTCTSSNKETQSQSTSIRYVQQQRDSIKLKITTIDSLQHEKVIEVQGLSNDSTLELFYKLIGK